MTRSDIKTLLWAMLAVTAGSLAATFLIVYRNHDDEIGFLEINAVTARLIELIEREDGRTGRELLTQIAEEIGHEDATTVIDAGRDILERLHRHDVILGTVA